ncbi:MAG: hypothetical protein R3B82_30640 [Sandaracinaceae bacterium]
MHRFTLASLLLVGCAPGAVPVDDPACAPDLLEVSGNDHLVSISNYVGLAGRYRPEVIIHDDGRVTTAGYDGSVLEMGSLGATRIAQLADELRASEALTEAEGCYEGSFVPAGPDDGCGIRVTLQLDGTIARFSGCGVPDAVRAAYDAAYRYETEARALEP